MPTQPQMMKIAAETGIVYIGEYFIQNASRPMRRVLYDIGSFASSEYLIKDRIDMFLSFLKMPEIQRQLSDLIGSYAASILIDMAFSDREGYQNKAILYVIAIFGENQLQKFLPMLAKS